MQPPHRLDAAAVALAHFALEGGDGVGPLQAKAFLKVGEVGSYAPGAKALGISASAICLESLYDTRERFAQMGVRQGRQTHFCT
jgi:hypothetical protein